MSPIIKIQRASFYMHYEKKNVAKLLYIYIKNQTLCKKQNNLGSVFIHKNLDTLRYANFHDSLKLAFI